MDLARGFLGHTAPAGWSTRQRVARKSKGGNMEPLSSQIADLKCDGCMKVKLHQRDCNSVVTKLDNEPMEH